MKIRKVVLAVVGLVGLVAVGVGTYGLVNLGECEATGNCRVSLNATLVAFIGGLALVVIACTAGAQLLLNAKIGAQMGALMGAAFEGTQNAPLTKPGRPAVGTVLSIADTGTTVNDDPLVRLQLRVEPVDGSASFEAVRTKLVSRLATPRPGDRFTVEYDPADPARIAVHEAIQEARPADSVVDQLARLDGLHRSGALTQAEFDAAKGRLLRLDGGA